MALDRMMTDSLEDALAMIECNDSGAVLATITLSRPLSNMSKEERYHLVSSLGMIGCEIMHHKTTASGWLVVFDPDQYRIIEEPRGESTTETKTNPSS